MGKIKKKSANQYDDTDTEFTPHGTYLDGYYGYEVMLSDDGESAKVKDYNGEISEWLPIEHVDTEELDEDGYPQYELYIDPEGVNIPLNQVFRINAFSNKKNNMKNELNFVANDFEKTSRVDDATDVWKSVREYMLSRTKGRYDTVDEMKDDINEKFKGIMESTQSNYDTWFNNELLPNYKLYDIEILGEDNDVVIEDEDMNSVDEGDMDMEGQDEMNDDIDLEDDDENMMNG